MLHERLSVGPSQDGTTNGRLSGRDLRRPSGSDPGNPEEVAYRLITHRNTQKSARAGLTCPSQLLRDLDRASWGLGGSRSRAREGKASSTQTAAPVTGSRFEQSHGWLRPQLNGANDFSWGRMVEFAAPSDRPLRCTEQPIAPLWPRASWCKCRRFAIMMADRQPT